MRACILVAGQTVPSVASRRGDFPLWMRDRTGDAWPGEWSTADLRVGASLPCPYEAEAFIITGSSSSVPEQTPWMQRAEQLVRDIAAAGVPLLGVCFGHQLVAHALGGDVQPNPRGREIGTVELRRVADDALFDGLPGSFDVYASHVDSVVHPPPGAVVLAVTDLEPVAAYRVGRSVWGVQFHPEYDADIMKGYIEARAHLIRGESKDPDALLARVHEGTRGDAVLRSFARLAAERRSSHGG